MQRVKSVFLEKLSAILQTDTWIIDGNYASTMEMRMQACDTVFFLDYSLEDCLAGIKERKGKARSDMPWVETDEDDEEFIAFIKNYNENNRPQVLQLIEKYPDKHVVVFTTRAEANAFLLRL